jgi:hypothetical protein
VVFIDKTNALEKLCGMIVMEKEIESLVFSLNY